jgi:hypothetical protein
MQKRTTICERLKELGYCVERTVKLYGEEVRLTSNPQPEGDGFVVEGVSKSSSTHKRIRVPLPVVKMVEREVTVRGEGTSAA